MLKSVFTVLLFTFIACQDKGVEPFLYESDTPSWLKDKIDYMSTNKDYGGTVVYRYEWKKNYVFHITIPISSCAMCDIYDNSGNKINFSENGKLQDYLDNRTLPVLVWEYSIKQVYVTTAVSYKY